MYFTQYVFEYIKGTSVNHVGWGLLLYFLWRTWVIFVLLLPSLSFRFSHSTFEVAFLKTNKSKQQQQNPEKEFWHRLLKYFHLLLLKSSLLLISYLFFQFFLFYLAFITSMLVYSQSYTSPLSLLLFYTPSFMVMVTGFSFSNVLFISLLLSSWSLITFYFKSVHVCFIFHKLVPFYYHLSFYETQNYLMNIYCILCARYVTIGIEFRQKNWKKD